MPEDNGFYKEQYFEQLNTRLDALEQKIDDLIQKVTYIYAFAAGVGTVAALITNFLMK